MRLALKIAYDGTKFSGSQRQPDVRTVDGECLFVLRKIGAIEGPKEARFQSASRTDKGVSAVGNVIAFDTDVLRQALIGMFNSHSRNVWAWAIANVPIGFNARKAIQRWYRYYMPGNLNLNRARKAAEIFLGKHDFCFFTRERNDTVKTLDSLELAKIGVFLCLDIKGQSFLRSMVRRVVAAIELYCEAKIELSQIEGALNGIDEDFGIAPAEPLILIDISYDFDFKVVHTEKTLIEISELLHESNLEQAKWTIFANRLENCSTLKRS